MTQKKNFNNLIRIINIFLFVILLVFFLIKDLRFLGAYFFIYVYLWVMITFVFLEMRQMIVGRINIVKHIKSDWKIFMGFLIVLFFAVNLLYPF